jgi:hypothetical protein
MQSNSASGAIVGGGSDGGGSSLNAVSPSSNVVANLITQISSGFQ